MKTLSIFGLMSSIIILVGCQSTRDAGQAPELNVIKRPGFSNKVLSGRSGNTLQKVYLGNTVISYEISHGTQVEYFASNGRVYLWYPGNKNVVKGKVRLRGGGQFGNRICFTYQSNSYNPVTGKSGGQESCSEMALQIRVLNESVRGDVFNLASGNVPFRLGSRKITLQKLYSRYWRETLKPKN